MGGNTVPQLEEILHMNSRTSPRRESRNGRKLRKLFANDPKLNNDPKVWGSFAPRVDSFAPRVEESIHSWFGQAKKTPLGFRYPGSNEAQHVKFAEDQDPAGVLKRTKFTIEFLTKLGKAFGQDPQTAVLRSSGGEHSLMVRTS